MVGYVPYKEEGEEVTPLAVRREIVEGNVAHHWGMKPWEFRALPPEQAAELHALYDLKNEIENYYTSEHRRMSKRNKDASAKQYPHQQPNRGR